MHDSILGPQIQVQVRLSQYDDELIGMRQTRVDVFRALVSNWRLRAKETKRPAE